MRMNFIKNAIRAMPNRVMYQLFITSFRIICAMLLSFANSVNRLIVVRLPEN